MTVESRGDVNAVGNGGRAIGPFQIHQGYWVDAIEYDPSLTANGQTYQNCKGPGSIEYSKRVMQVKTQGCFCFLGGRGGGGGGCCFVCLCVYYFKLLGLASHSIVFRPFLTVLVNIPPKEVQDCS